MSIRSHTNRMRRRVLFGLVALSLVGYFGWHSFNGNYGIVARERLKTRVAELEQEHGALKAERMALERRVSLLKPESLDPDMLEERVRESLTLVHPNDLVVMQRRRGIAN